MKKYDIDHVAFVVPNIEDAVNWYLENAKAKIIYKDKTWALIDIFGNKIAFALPNMHPNHVALLVKSKDQFPEFLLENDEIRQHRDGSQYIYLKDPFGNAIEWVLYP